LTFTNGNNICSKCAIDKPWSTQALVNDKEVGMRGVEDEDLGCAYPLDDAGGIPPIPCGAARQPGSSFCPEHHVLCHIPAGSMAECRTLDEAEALARVVGGRLGRELRAPPEPLLRRLDRVSRLFSCPDRSRIVHGGSMAKRPTAKLDNAITAGLGPTPERLRHGLVEPIAQPIADAAGHPARPYRAVDTLAVMERRGSITAEMRQAGEDFRARFAVAQLDPLRALDLTHLRVAETGPNPDREAPGPRIEAARRSVWRVIQAVGGMASPAGSCLWHVLGWELPVKEWALQQGWSGRRVSQETASGILIAALGALESHLGHAESLRKTHF
jgi:hypothetical protein